MIEKYSHDGKVVFNSENHTYKLVESGKLLTSVTSVIKHFETPFNKEGKSIKKALQLGITQAEVLKMWKEKSDKSIRIGNITHLVFEKFFIKNLVECYRNIPQTMIASDVIYKFFKTGILRFVQSEYIVYNDFIAGQIDGVILTKSNRLVIIDFKTNEVLNYDNFNTFFKPPYNNIPQSKMSIYTMQLNIYKQLYNNSHDVKIEGLTILNITSTGYKFIEIHDISQTYNLQPMLNYENKSI